MKRGLSAAILGCAVCWSAAEAQSPLDIFLEPHRDEICASLEPLPIESCQAILEEALSSRVLGDSDTDELKERVEDELLDPAFLNSALANVFGGSIPLGLEFKMLDTEDGESVLGMSYAVDYELKSGPIQPKEKWARNYFVEFHANGTLTQDAERNPRNFQDIKFQLGASKSTRIPPQDPEFQSALTDANVERARACNTNADSDECREADARMFALLDSTMDFVRAFQYYDYGVELGYETTQGSSASAKKFGAFFSGQYESWGDSSFLGAIGVTPAFRIGLDSMDPDLEAPRATLAGDDSDYLRLSGEISFWKLLPGPGQPLALTFSYRHHRELDASDAVKAAGLESYNLRTLTLSSSSGIVVSYSSGRLPLAEQDDNVLTLGWQTHF